MTNSRKNVFLCRSTRFFLIFAEILEGRLNGLQAIFGAHPCAGIESV